MTESEDLKDLVELHFEDILSFVESGVNLPRDQSIICAFCTLLYNYRDNKLSKDAAGVNKDFRNLIKKNRPWETRYRDLSKCKTQARLVAARIINNNS